MSWFVIEGIHTDPNNRDTIDHSTKERYGPMKKHQAESLALSLIQKNVDNFYHRAWVIEDE